MKRWSCIRSETSQVRATQDSIGGLLVRQKRWVNILECVTRQIKNVERNAEPQGCSSTGTAAARRSPRKYRRMVSPQCTDTRARRGGCVARSKTRMQQAPFSLLLRRCTYASACPCNPKRSPRRRHSLERLEKTWHGMRCAGRGEKATFISRGCASFERSSSCLWRLCIRAARTVRQALSLCAT